MRSFVGIGLVVFAAIPNKVFGGSGYSFISIDRFMDQFQYIRLKIGNFKTNWGNNRLHAKQPWSKEIIGSRQTFSETLSSKKWPVGPISS